MNDLVLLAGASGAIGRHAVGELQRSGYRVRATGREVGRLAALGAEECRCADLTQPESLRGIAEGCRYVISTAGARMTLGLWSEKAPFEAIDHLGNRALLKEARAAGCEKFVYVSLAGALALRHTAYAQAHERFVTTLAESGTSYCVVRPTGLFSFFRELLHAAGKGPLFSPCDGRARSNPIHEADAARAVVEALSSPETQLTVGGPEVLTRGRIFEMVFEAHGKPPNVKRAPGWLIRAPLPMLRAVQPRIAALVEFGLAVSEVDVIAPCYGTRRLGDYLRAAAREG